MYVVHVRRIPIRSTCTTYMCDSVNIHRTCTAYMISYMYMYAVHVHVRRTPYMYAVHVRRTCTAYMYMYMYDSVNTA